MNYPKKSFIEYWNDRDVVQLFTDNGPSEHWQRFFSQSQWGTGQRILDLACGGGRNATALLDSGFDVYACDLHVAMAQATWRRVAQSLGPDIASGRVCRADMLTLPYADGSFDIVLANGAYHNVASLPQFEQALRETARVLRSGGLLCLAVFTRSLVDPRLESQGLPGLYRTPDGLDLVLLLPEEIRHLCESYGLLPSGDPQESKVQVPTGVRSCLRGVFIRRLAG